MAWLLLTAVAVLGGCRLDIGAVPAVVGEQPGMIQSGWLPPLPDRPGGRPEEVVGLRIFDRYLIGDEPATGIVRLNRHNIPWPQRVHVEMWDEAGLNLLSSGVLTIEPGESYLVRVGLPARIRRRYEGQTLQLRARAGVWQVAGKLTLLPPLPAPDRPGWFARSWPQSLDQSDLLAAAALPGPVPPGPVGPDDAPLHLIAAPGETVAAAALLWPTQLLDGLSGRFTPGRDMPPLTSEVARRQTDGRFAPLTAADELEPTGDNLLRLTLTVAADAPAGGQTTAGQWAVSQGEQVIFARPVYLTTVDLPGPDLPAWQRYVAAAREAIARARADASPARRQQADRLARLLAAAEDYYANRVAAPTPLLAEPTRPLPFKLRWLSVWIVRTLSQ